MLIGVLPTDQSSVELGARGEISWKFLMQRGKNWKAENGKKKEKNGNTNIIRNMYIFPHSLLK